MKPQIAGIIGSPRKGMNTDTIVQKILDGCQYAGASIEKCYLNDLDIEPCQACRVQDGEGCKFHDGMDQIYDLFDRVDGIVLGTPIYYNSASSQMKLMIDRSYCLARIVLLPTGNSKYLSTVNKRKLGFVVAIGGSGQNPECVLPMFKIWSPEVNLEITHQILVTEGLLGGLPMENNSLLQNAYEQGIDFTNKMVLN